MTLDRGSTAPAPAPDLAVLARVRDGLRDLPDAGDGPRAATATATATATDDTPPPLVPLPRRR